MNRKINTLFILALGISLAFAACNSGDKKEESTSTTDSTSMATDTTSTAKTETAAPANDAMDAVKVAPNLYKPLKDSMGIRVLEVNYKPGDSSAMHSHPDYVLYVINGGSGE